MPAHTPDQIAALVFLDIAVIVVVARLMGMLFRRLRQPAVVGEIIAGIALGPSLLGTLPGDLPVHLFPLDVRPSLRIVAQLGLIIFMFIVGLELDVALIRGKERIAATISLVSVVLPFAMGVGLAVMLHHNHGVVAGKKVEFLPFALFIGASMSVTAFPVLARILTERGMYRTEIGALTLACAAVDDILAWSMLAVVLAVVAATGALGLPLILGESIAFVAVMFVVVRPQLRRLVTAYDKAGRLTPNILAVVLVGFLLCSYLTDRIGIHSIFGAFVFGVVMPRENSRALFHEILEKLEQVSVLLLLPVFFIATGLNVDVRGLGGSGVVELLAVLAVACTGKFVGASTAARAMGIRSRKAAAIGVLMNTRGLTELVILNIGLAVGVLDKELFTILVLMAIFTTVITEPLLRLVYPDKMLARDIAEAERAALGLVDAYRVLAMVPATDAGETDLLAARVVDAGVALLGNERPSELVLTRFDRPVKKVEVGSGLSGELMAIAASFGASQDLVHRAAGLGAKAVMRSQFSEEPARDLLAQSLAVEADAVLVPVDAADPAAVRTAERLLADVDCAVVLVAGGAPPRDASVVVVLTGPGDDGMAALAQAVRLSRPTGAPLELLDVGDRREGRRMSGLVERLTAAGVSASVRAASTDAWGVPAGSLLVAGLEGRRRGRGLTETLAAVTAAHSGPLLLVRSAGDDRGESLYALLDQTAPAQG
ncbi:MAG: cation/H(+) antiporter [Frankiales bacterium]|nr:cation/H(+) antiporter [Frankiales bacterium]